MDRIEKVLSFVQLLHKFQQVERRIWFPKRDEYENDVEHSYFLAVLAWYIIDVNNLELSKDLVIKYALLHDFVEVYAGDTYFYEKDQSVKDSKKQREDEAAIKLKGELSEFSEMHKIIEQYELKENEESKFVYALDKLIPIITSYLDEGKAWKIENLTPEQLFTLKKEKVSMSPEIRKYYDLLVELILKDQVRLFNQNEEI